MNTNNSEGRSVKINAECWMCGGEGKVSILTAGIGPHLAHCVACTREHYGKELAELQMERDALAAHVVELVKGGRALHDELQQWSLTERDPETSAAMAKWRTVVGEQPSLSPLYRRDARMKAEALEEFGRACVDIIDRRKAKHLPPSTASNTRTPAMENYDEIMSRADYRETLRLLHEFNESLRDGATEAEAAATFDRGFELLQQGTVARINEIMNRARSPHEGRDHVAALTQLMTTGCVMYDMSGVPSGNTMRVVPMDEWVEFEPDPRPGKVELAPLSREYWAPGLADPTPEAPCYLSDVALDVHGLDEWVSDIRNWVAASMRCTDRQGGAR